MVKTERRGISTFEVTTAALLMTTIIIAVSSILSLGLKYQRFSHRQSLAITEVSNIAERLYQVDYAQLQSGPCPVAVTDEVTQLLEQPVASLTVSETTKPIGKKITILLQWSDKRNGEASLTVYRYQPIAKVEEAS